MNFDPKINSLIQEIAGLCYQIKCARGYDVFFHIHTHVDWVEVRGYNGPWTMDSPPDWSVLVRLVEGGAVQKLGALRHRLALILSRESTAKP